MFPIVSIISLFVSWAILCVRASLWSLLLLYLILTSSWSSSLVSMLFIVLSVTPFLPIWIRGLMVWACCLSFRFWGGVTIVVWLGSVLSFLYFAVSGSL